MSARAFWLTRYLFVCLTAVSVACSEVSPPPPPSQPRPAAIPGPGEPHDHPDSDEFPTHFTHVFTREYGYWLYRSCALRIDLWPMNRNHAELECEPITGSRVKSTQDLRIADAFRLRRLAVAADLYGPDHIGDDSTPGDGRFETLRLRPSGGGRAVVLVTSRNRSFVEHQARRELLELLEQVYSGLMENIPRGNR